MKTRVKILKTVLYVAVAVILVRLFVIQIIEHNDWVARAEDEHIVQSTIKAKRGEIYMMDGDEPSIVVMNETVWTIVVDPMVADADKVQATISREAGDKVTANWNDVFADKTRRYYVVARGVKEAQVEKIQAAELAGIWYLRGNARVYPEGQMASSLLGFVNTEGEGQYGVEGALNKELAGENGVLKTVTDVNNIALSIGDDNVRVPAVDGKNVVLSIDKNVQNKLEKVLQNGIDTTKATNAAGIVMDPTTGEVWAMANLPTYDATNYAKVEDASVFINVPLESAYEPGSMCKSFSFAAAVDQGKITPQTTYVNQGYLVIDGWKIENAYEGQIGTITMQTGLAYSLNTSSMTALMALGDDPSQITQKSKDVLYDYYYNKFGLGQYTGIELIEAPGYVTKPDAEEAYNSRYANMSFGQGLTLTMMQVAAGFSSVVNGGEYYKPTIIAGEVTNDGTFLYNDAPEAVRRTISAESSATMRQMLKGTRNMSRLYGVDKPGYLVGGKTGTSQGIKNGEYTFDETVGSYVGFGGAEGDLPEYVIIVKIWGEGQTLGGGDAQTLFDQMSNYMIDYLRIKPGETV